MPRPESQPFNQSQPPRNNDGDPRAESMNPLAAASEFTRICKMLDEREVASFRAGEEYHRAGQRLNAGNPTEQLHALLSQHYAGTPWIQGDIRTPVAKNQ